jgi:hypothetical protein
VRHGVRQHEHVRRRRQRTVGFAGPDMPREGEARPLARERGLGRAVREFDRRRPRGEHLRLRRPPRAVERSGRRLLEPRLVDLRRDRARLPFRIVACEPCDRDLASGRQRGDLGRDVAARGVPRRALGPEAQLLRGRELLHQADTRHRHRVAVQTPAIGAIGGDVVEAGDQFGVGPRSGRGRHFASGVSERALGRDLRRPGQREPLGFRERERHAALRGSGARKRSER